MIKKLPKKPGFRIWLLALLLSVILLFLLSCQSSQMVTEVAVISAGTEQPCIVLFEPGFTGPHTLKLQVIAAPQKKTMALKRRQRQAKSASLECAQLEIFRLIKEKNPQLRSQTAGAYIRTKIPEIMESIQLMQEDFDDLDNVKQQLQIHYPNLREYLGEI